MSDTHIVTIREYAKPQDGYTHCVRIPCFRTAVRVQSIEDARKVAHGFTPGDGKPVQVIEQGPQRRTRKLGLRLSR